MADTAIAFSWKITQLERELVDGCVITAHYLVDATDGEHVAGGYGSVPFSRPDGDLIPFADLTEETVLGWLKAALGSNQVAHIEAMLMAEIQEKRQPTKSEGLPWAN
jgi:hypothetical protein